MFPRSTVLSPTRPLGGACQAPGGRWLQNGWLEVKELLPLMVPALRGSVSASSPFVYVDVGCKDAAEGVFVLETFPEGAQVDAPHGCNHASDADADRDACVVCVCTSAWHRRIAFSVRAEGVVDDGAGAGGGTGDAA